MPSVSAVKAHGRVARLTDEFLLILVLGPDVLLAGMVCAPADQRVRLKILLFSESFELISKLMIVSPMFLY